MQVAAGTLIILATCSPYRVWTGLSLDPVVATPAMCLLLYYVGRLLSVGAGLSNLQVQWDILSATFLGVGVGLGISYIAFAANGAERTNTTTRVR